MIDPKMGDQVRVSLHSISTSGKALRGRVGTVTMVDDVNKFLKLDIENELPYGGGGLHFREVDLYERKTKNPCVTHEFEQVGILIKGKNQWIEEDPKAKWAKEGRCPECGELGKFIRAAMVCSVHGTYGGC